MFCCESRGKALIVRLTGELDHRAAGEMRAQLDARIEETGARRLIFDMQGLEFMDSSGIGLIIGRYKQMQRRGGHVSVRGVGPQIDRIMKMAGLYELVSRQE